MTVEPQEFVASMTNLWIERKYAVSEPLKQCWQQLAETFNNHITGNNSHSWSVLHPPTGTGKSQGLAKYCSMLSLENHIGVLVVVRMKNDADELAKTINKMSNKQIAISCHSENIVEPEKMAATPVLIITHSAFEQALEISNKWEKITAWSGCKRKLTVIDEALNIVKNTQIQLDDLRIIRGHIPLQFVQKYSKEIAILDTVIEKITACASDKNSRILERSYWGNVTGALFTDLKMVIKSIPWDTIILESRNEEEKQAISERHIKCLDKLEIILNGWCRYATKGTQHTLTTSRIILPKNMVNAVILDATAPLNPIYGMLDDAVKLIAPPKNIRSYRNVKLHVSTKHKVGKISLTEKGAKDAPLFMADLSKRIVNKRVLICTHKSIKAHFEGYKSLLPEYDVINWGAIDGKNYWCDYEAVALFGLPYLDQSIIETLVIAIEKWTEQKFTSYKHQMMVEQLYWGHLKVCLVQAINRVRCRNTIDTQGNCDATDIYLLLPNPKQSTGILEAIRESMPEIIIESWQSNVAKKKVRRSSYEAPLLSYLVNVGRGNYIAKEIRQHLDIPKRAFEKLITKVKDDSSQLYTELTDICVTYTSSAGRGAKSWFAKA